MAKVLIVEDDEVIGRGISGHLANAGFEPMLRRSGRDGARAPSLRAAGRRGARPDAPGNRRLGADPDGARRRDRHADPRRQRARHRAGPRASAGDSAPTTTSSSRSRCRSSLRASARPRAAACAHRKRRVATRSSSRSCCIDPREVQAYVDGREREPDADGVPAALRARARSTGRVVTREELMQRIWGRRQRHRDRTVDVFVRKLRNKIDRHAPAHTFLHTRHGVGYKLQALPK